MTNEIDAHRQPVVSTKDAAGAPMIARRTLLAALPAAGAVALMPGIASAGANPPGDTAIMSLFREWDAIWKHTEHLFCAEEEMNAFVHCMAGLERQILALPSTDACDFAAKLIARTSYNQFDILEGDELFVEAVRLVTGAPM